MELLLVKLSAMPRPTVSVGQPERATQNRVIALFVEELGYRYLGDWTSESLNRLPVRHEEWGY